MKKGVLKTTKGYARAAKISIITCITLLALSLVGLVTTAVVGYNYTKEFRDTSEYKTAYVQEVKDILGDYKEGKISFEESSDKITEIQTSDGVVELLKASSNEELKAKYEKVEKAEKGFEIGGLAAFGGLLGTFIAGSAYNLKKKEKEEENLDCE